MQATRDWIVRAMFVVALISAESPPALAALRHHWALDENVASTNSAVDSVGGKNGTIGAAVVSETGIVGGAFRFVANNPQSQVEILNFDTTGLASITLAFWMNPTGDILTPNFKRIISAADNFEAILQNNTGQLANNLHLSGATYPMTPGGVVQDQWIHVAMTSDANPPGTGAMQTYVNGELIDTVPNNPTPTAVNPFLNTAATLKFGHRPGQADTQRFTGLLDDIRIYDTILSQSEIQELANVERPDPLTLQVNTITGQVVIKNINPTVPQAENLIFYKIASPANGLVPGSWNSLDDQGIDETSSAPPGDYNLNGTVDAADYVVWRETVNTPAGYDLWRENFGESGSGTEPGNGWDESGGSSASQLIELRLTGHSTLDVDEMYSLGAIYNTTIDDRNLMFEYSEPGGNLVAGLVEYVSSGSALPASVPEPTSLWLFICAVVSFAFRRARSAALVIASSSLLLTSTVEAVEIHRYTFNNGTADDSIGSAHGTLINPQGTNRYAAGQLNLTGNNGLFNTQLNSGQDYTSPTARGAYVDLPNSIVSQAFGGVPNGVPGDQIGAASFEIWYTMDTNRNSARAWHFGHQDGGVEDSPTVNTGGHGSADIGLEPQASVSNVPRLRFQNRFNDTSTANPAVLVQVDYAENPSPINVQQHVVVTLDHDDTSGGANPNGTAKVYVDGVSTPAVTGPIAPGLFLETFAPFGDLNNWLGRSMFAGNPLFDGAMNEFRIYDQPMTAAQVSASFAAGPTSAGTPLAPTLLVNRNTGAVTLASQESTALEVTSYTITSASGTLNPMGWTSLDDASTSWTESSATGSQLSESETSVGTVGSLAPGGQLNLGSAYLPSPFEDLSFTYTLSNGNTGGGFVKYSGTTLTRSDLNGDGSVNTADWAIFLANNFTSLAGSSPAVAYRKGDLDFDLDNDFNDYLLFRNDYIAANGAGAFLALTESVPEPSTIALMAIAVAGCVFRNRSVRRHY